MINPGKVLREVSTCIAAATAGCDSILELGCGMGDNLALCPGKLRLGVDAYRPYVDEAAGRHRDPLLSFACMDARVFAAECQGNFDAVLLIDFLEHLEKSEGLVLLGDCRRIAAKRIVLFVPEGFHAQTDDIYHKGGEHWQTHRSGWTVEELTALGFDVARWEDFHPGVCAALFALREET